MKTNKKTLIYSTYTCAREERKRESEVEKGELWRVALLHDR